MVIDRRCGPERSRSSLHFLPHCVVVDGRGSKVQKPEEYQKIVDECLDLWRVVPDADSENDVARSRPHLD